MRLRIITRRPELPPLHLRSIRTPPRRSAAVSPLAEALADDPLERETEVLREQGVYQWINCAVAVAQPEEHGKQQGIETVFAEGAYQVDSEKGQPAEYETADDDAQCLRGFGFHPEAFYLRFDIALAHPTRDYFRFVGAVFAGAWTGARRSFWCAVATARPGKL